MLVAVAEPDKVPAVVEVPSLKILEFDVNTLPEVNVSVPLIESGTDNVTPVEFELLIVRPDKSAVLEAFVVAFLKNPVPEIVCALLDADAELPLKLDNTKFPDVGFVRVSLFTKFPEI